MELIEFIYKIETKVSILTLNSFLFISEDKMELHLNPVRNEKIRYQDID